MTSFPDTNGIVTPGRAEVEAAAARIAPHVVRTPLLECRRLGEQLGRRVFIKAECLQHTGAFKIRGALNRICQFTAAERRGGVIAFSSGNHAQAIATVGRRLGVKVTVIMPVDAPPVKVAAASYYGAEIVRYDRRHDDREAMAAEIAAARGAVIVPSFEDPRIIAGQGTVGLEILQQAAELGVRLDAIAAPCGGGGLAAGIAAAVRPADPLMRLFAVEPAGYDDMAQSLAAGEPIDLASDVPPSICDALLVRRPGRLTLSILREAGAEACSVTDDEVRAAMRLAFDEARLVLEPGGAVALAALVAGRLPDAVRDVAIIASGGNVDPGLFADVVTTRAAA